MENMSDSINNKVENEDSTSESEKGLKCLTLGEVLDKKKVKEDDEEYLSPTFVNTHQRLLKLYALIDDDTEEVKNVRNTAIRQLLEKEKSEEKERFCLESYIAKREKDAMVEYKELDERWDCIVELKDPLDLNTETAIHREKCNGLIKEKDSEIEYLKQVLKKKDEEFVNEIENQGVDIKFLLDKIEEQIIKSKNAYTNELESLEEMISEEKKLMMKANREKWEKLMNEKDKVDKAFIEKICKLLESQQQPMLLAEKEHKEYKRIMRTKLDKYGNDLILQTEFLKSVCILNIEKMTYNHQLLYNKQQDNNIIKEHSRKYNVRMGNILAKARQELEEKRLGIISNINFYSTKIDRLNKQIISIDNRCDDLALSNSKKYFDLWNFVEREVKDLIQEICICDKIIYEEYLLVPWVSPNFQISKLTSYITGMKLIQDFSKKKKLETTKPSLPKRLISKMQILSKIIFDGLQYSLLNQNKKANQSVLPAEKKELLQLNKILDVLGVKTEEHIQLLLKYFYPYIVCPECDILDNQRDPVSTDIFKRQEIVLDSEGNYNEDESLQTSSSEPLSIDSAASELSLEESEVGTLSDIARRAKFELTSKIVDEETLILKDEETYAWKVDPFTVGYLGGYSEPDLPIEQALKIIDGTDCEPHNEEQPVVLNKDTFIRICSEPTHHPYINPLDITKALESFTFDVYKSKEFEPSLNVEEILAKDRCSPSRIMAPQEVTDYWDSYLKVVSKRKVQLWNSMTCVVQDYLRALQKRHDMNGEIKKLQLTKNELERLIHSLKYSKMCDDGHPMETLEERRLKQDQLFLCQLALGDLGCPEKTKTIKNHKHKCVML